MTYEQAIEQLEAIVLRLEQEQLPLDEVVTLYEKGNALAEECRKHLQAGSTRLQQLLQTRDGFVRVEEEET